GLGQHQPLRGTSAVSIYAAEAGSKSGVCLVRLGIDQPEWSKLESLEGAAKSAAKIGYAVLIRPSYVLSGAAMNVAFDEQQMIQYIREASRISKESPVVI